MRNFSASSQNLVDEILSYATRNNMEHDDMIYALLLVLYSDMRAFGDKEHNLVDSDGVCLVNARLME